MTRFRDSQEAGHISEGGHGLKNPSAQTSQPRDQHYVFDSQQETDGELIMNSIAYSMGGITFSPQNDLWPMVYEWLLGIGYIPNFDHDIFGMPRPHEVMDQIDECQKIGEVGLRYASAAERAIGQQSRETYPRSIVPDPPFWMILAVLERNGAEITPETIIFMAHDFAVFGRVFYCAYGKEFQ